MPKPVPTSNQKKSDMNTQTLEPGDLVTLREIEGMRPFELTHPCNYNGEPNYIETNGCQFNIVSVKDDVVELGDNEPFRHTKRCHIAHCVLVSKYEDRPKAWIEKTQSRFLVWKLTDKPPTYARITAEISCDTSPEMLQEVLSRIVNSQS